MTAAAAVSVPVKRSKAKRARKQPAPATCGVCSTRLDWRDDAYAAHARTDDGKSRICKRCKQRNERLALRGRFIPAGEYLKLLNPRWQQDERERAKARRKHKPIPAYGSQVRIAATGAEGNPLGPRRKRRGGMVPLWLAKLMPRPLGGRK